MRFLAVLPSGTAANQRLGPPQPAASTKAFSEVEYDLHEVISHNGCVAVRATMHACHEETGKEGEIDGIAILRFDGDRIAEEWSSWDYPDLVNQLGLSEDG